MAAFTQDPNELSRLDWQILQNSSVALYLSHKVLAGDVAWFEQHGYRIVPIRAEEAQTAEAYLVALGKALDFPAYFGRNLNAFNDCLSDLAVPVEGGLAIVLHDFDRFASTCRQVAQTLLDIFAENARRFLLTGQRLVVLVHSSDPTIVFEPVGATQVAWNPKEWLISKRGL